MLNILVLEDESPAIKKLESLLEKTIEGPYTLTVRRTVSEAIGLFSSGVLFDLILSDIKLLDGTSFDIFQKVEVNAPIIFCTAYDSHLLEAFQTNGIAYLLKPFSENEFKEALKKYKSLFQSKIYQDNLIDQLKKALNRGSKVYKRRFAIKKPEGIKLLEVQEVSIVQAFGDLCKLIDHTGKLHSISSNIGTLEDVLDPEKFFKINRSQIINQDHILNIRDYSKNRLELQLKGNKEKVLTSSTKTKEFRKWLDR
ncbi:MAG: LytTR family DNA-binding domain-containing protein [Bacteroidota bacterium]